MKIVLVNIAYFPNVEGGAEISTQKLAEALAQEHDVYVISNGEEKKMPEIINGVNVFRLPVRIKSKNKVVEVITRNYKIQCKQKLRDLLKTIKPDVIHTNNLHEFSVIVWKIAYELEIPVVHTLRDYSLAKQHWAFERRIVLLCSNLVLAITAPSKYTLNYFTNLNMFLKAQYKYVIPNAIDFRLSDVSTLIDEKSVNYSAAVRFAYLGRFSKMKGVDWLIKVFHESSLSSNLYLFGKGNLSDQSNIILQIDNRISNQGFLEESDLCDALKDIDVIVAPSLWEEPFGRIILDGYKNACPVIVTNKGGMPEVVDNQNTGIIINTTDDELIQALFYFQDKKNIIRMLPKIKNKICEFSMNTQKEAFLDLYKKIIDFNNKRG